MSRASQASFLLFSNPPDKICADDLDGNQDIDVAKGREVSANVPCRAFFRPDHDLAGDLPKRQQSLMLAIVGDGAGPHEFVD